jgi:hydroxymethylpyrimidine/phosphomethylpyrimidine kinase
MTEVPHVLTIAGSDPSGGAGIQADLKTFHAFGVYGMAVLTSLTAQNTRGVAGIHDVPPEFVRSQLETVFDDVHVDIAKTGMLKSVEIIETVAEEGGRLAGRLVVDPVMVATSGDRLIENWAVQAMKERLFPIAAVVTPNRAEAEALAGMEVNDLEAAHEAAHRILGTRAPAVLVKGIPDGDDIVDLLVTREVESVHRLPALRVDATHGTGCTLSAAIAAGLGLGHPLPEAVRRAKGFVWRAIRDAFPVGGGSLPLNHLVPSEEPSP